MKLIVKNFGPIKDAELETKQFTVLIGPQASGKSILAKLLSIFRDTEFMLDQNLSKFLAEYNIEFLSSNTYIEYQEEDHYIRYSNSRIESNLRLKPSLKASRTSLDQSIEKKAKEIASESIIDTINNSADFKNFTKEQKEIMIAHFAEEEKKRMVKEIKLKSNDHSNLYIPTERIFVASISDFLYNFIKSDINLPEFVVNFGAVFENTRKHLSNFKIPFLTDIEYSFENGMNKLRLKDQQTINFTQSSSGLQAVVPMAILIEYFSRSKNTNFVIEEPELNLYPISQKKLAEYISTKCLGSGNNLIITTHSPYILTSFANLIQAHNAAQTSKAAKKQVAQIFPEESWIDFDQVSAYYINNGTATDILDRENQTIDANAIDDVSEAIAGEFEALMNIKYGD